MTEAEIIELVGVRVDGGPDPRVLAQLKMGGSGDEPRPRAILENLATILGEDPRWRGRVYLSDHDGRTYLDGKAITDGDESEAALWLSRNYDVAPGSALVGEALRLVGRANRRHPPRDYLDRCRAAWDGCERIDRWLATYLGVAPDPLSSAIGRCFLLSAVARLRAPGCKVDTVLILVGGQGAGKSTALRVLAGEWFSDTPITVGSKDVYEQLSGIWIYELAELDAFRKAEWPAIKALISSPADNVRRAYARNAVIVPRQSVWVGTSNRKDFLADSTGSRRFWPVEVAATGPIDLTNLRRERDQLWGEAVARYEAGEAWWLPGDLDAALADRAEEYEQADPWAARVAAFAKGQSEIEIGDLLARALDRPAHAQTPHDSARAGNLLAELGFVRRRRRRDDGSRPTVWVRG
jgi:putative DNA primase/helicase